MTCRIEGCSEKTGRYGTAEVHGEKKFLALCWPHYKLLVKKERSVDEKDSRQVVMADCTSAEALDELTQGIVQL